MNPAHIDVAVWEVTCPDCKTLVLAIKDAEGFYICTICCVVMKIKDA